ncbi:MAG: MBOAT family O-acyltransferase [Candidatus Melainabacteria bacterium]|nr:MBOAT family O-acyltransferase [Candidatus Melainabacteria bacterium]
MLFSSFNYLVFLPIVFGLYWVLPDKFRKPLLLLASYFFYMSWLPKYGLLLFGLTIANYFLGLLISKSVDRKKLFLTIAVSINLGCLCFFKYTNFLLDSLWQGLRGFTQVTGVTLAQTTNTPMFDILLPLGISFFAFEFIHYVVDVYKGSPPMRNFFDFALFGAFFPSQIAGPIKRFQDFSKQLIHPPVFSKQDFNDGVVLILQGLFKKVCLGDMLAQLIVDPGYANPAALGTLDAWIVFFAFTFQVFFDFSGYTDIGRGSALLFGYRVPENFNLPFLSANFLEIWRRWHISLSTWLRDYLYIPLGGSHCSAWAQRRNLFLTMALGGLWHGAAWHYVFFGCIQGVILATTRDWQKYTDKHPTLSVMKKSPWWHWSAVVATFWSWTVLLVIFRAPSVTHAFSMYAKGFSSSPAGEITTTFMTSTLPVTLVLYGLYCITCALANRTIEKEQALPAVAGWVANAWKQSVPARAIAYTAMAVVILAFAPGHVQPFVYFQF